MMMKNNRFILFTVLAVVFLSAILAADNGTAQSDTQIINALVAEGIKENKTVGKIPLKEYKKSKFLASYVNSVKNHPGKDYISYKVLSDLFKGDAPNAALKLFPLTKLNPRGCVLLLEDLFVNNNSKPYFLKAVEKIIKTLPEGAIEEFSANKILFAHDTYVSALNCPKIQDGTPLPVLDAMDLIIKELCTSDKYDFPYNCLQKNSVMLGDTSSILKLWADSYAELYTFYPNNLKKYHTCDAYLELPRRLTAYWKNNTTDTEVQEVIAETNPPQKIKRIFLLK